MDKTLYLATIFPNPAFTKIGQDIGTATVTVEIGDMSQNFVYAFQSYSGGTLGLHTGCFEHEVAVLTGIAQARLLCWDVAGFECGPNF